MFRIRLMSLLLGVRLIGLVGSVWFVVMPLWYNGCAPRF